MSHPSPTVCHYARVIQTINFINLEHHYQLIRMKRTDALVVTGYHTKEAAFGRDVTEHYQSRRLKSGRHIDFYAVSEGSIVDVAKGKFGFPEPKVDDEIRRCLARREAPDLVLNIHGGEAEKCDDYDRRSGSRHGAVDLACAKVPAAVVWKLSKLMGEEYVFSDIVPPTEEALLEELQGQSELLAQYEERRPQLIDTIAQTGLPTITVEPYLFSASFGTKDGHYWRRVGQTARLINMLYDTFETCRSQNQPPGSCDASGK